MTPLNASAAEIKGAIDDVKGAIENIAQLANSLNEQMENQDTPLGLLTDKETAVELRRIVANAEELTESSTQFSTTRVFFRIRLHISRVRSFGIKLKARAARSPSVLVGRQNRQPAASPRRSIDSRLAAPRFPIGIIMNQART